MKILKEYTDCPDCKEPLQLYYSKNEGNIVAHYYRCPNCTEVYLLKKEK